MVEGDSHLIEQSKKFLFSIQETDVRLKELLKECKPMKMQETGLRDSIDWRNTSLPQAEIESLPGYHYKSNSVQSRGLTRVEMLGSSINNSVHSGGVDLFEQVLE